MRESQRTCKLCGSDAVFQFALPLVEGLTGEYYECGRCRMLQSYHLDALSPAELGALYARPTTLIADKGAAWRQFCVVSRLQQLARCGLIPRSRRGFRLLDYGGGSGFTSSLMSFRLGWESYTFDAYSTPCFAPENVLRSWTEVTARGPFHMIVSTEVFEHLLRPREEFQRIAAVLSPEEAYVYITTGRYEPGLRNADWPYLAPSTGQHVCFYSRHAIETVARLLKMDAVYCIGAEYEWLLVRSAAARSPLHRLRQRATAAVMRRGVRSRLLRRIE